MRPVSRLLFCSMRKACAFLRPPRACLARTIRFDCIRWDAWRPGETISDLLVATWVCVQAASEAAPRITASHCTTLRRPEPELKGAPMQICFDVDVRSSGTAAGKHIVPRLPNPTRKGRNPIGAEPSQTRAIAASFTRFHVSVVIEPHLAVDKQAIGAVPASQGQWSRPEFVAISWQYLRSYFRLPEPHIAARQNRLPAISWKPSRNDWQSHFSGDVFLALAKPPAPVRWHRAMLTPLASHPWPLRVQFRVAARQNRRRDRRVPAKAHL